MDGLKIVAIINGSAQTLFEESGGPVYRFTGQEKTYRATINYTVATPPKVQTNRCHTALQGKVAWNYEGNKAWAKGNLDKMCKLNNQTHQPAKCFQNVMHGNVSWGGGTKWQWGNVVDLCQGTFNANRTVVCFKHKIQQGVGWSTAIGDCKLSSPLSSWDPGASTELMASRVVERTR